MPTLPVTVNDQTFERWGVQSELPVAIAFCTPRFEKCQALEPLLARLAAEYDGRLRVARLVVDDNREWSRHYSVRDLPTLLFLRGGELRDRAVGLPDWPELTERADALLAGRAPRITPKPTPEPASTGEPLVVTDATFERAVLKSDRPVLVDFWAPWCGPCRMIAPHLDTLARELGNQAVIAKLNVDENPATAGHYGVQGIPTLLIFKHGQVVDKIVGAQPAQVLRQRLQRQLA
jgi:thioredoxin